MKYVLLKETIQTLQHYGVVKTMNEEFMYFWILESPYC